MPSEVDDFLAGYEASVRKLALSVRKLVQRIAPDSDEKVLVRWKTIAYGRRTKFCAISPHREWVNLQFHAGASLDDPEGLLEGTGKSMRHVKLRAPADVKRSALSKLIQQASKAAE